MKKGSTTKLLARITALTLCIFMTLGFLGCTQKKENNNSDVSSVITESETQKDEASGSASQKEETNTSKPKEEENTSKPKEETNSKAPESSKPADASSKEQDKPISSKDEDASDAIYQSISETGAITTYKGGKFPKEVNIGDVYICGDYIYKYGYLRPGSSKTWYKSEDEGWGVSLNVPRDKQSYGEILYTINNKTLSKRALQDLFSDCTALKVAPAIPNGVTDIPMTFYGCTSLVSVPDIPNSVTNMSHTFQKCTSLKKPPKLPSKVEIVYGTFRDCTALETAPAIPNTVTEMLDTFMGCHSLKTVPDLPDSVKSMTWTFAYCYALETAPKLPKNLERLNEAFVSCKALKKMSAIPKTAQVIVPFDLCVNLEGEIEINTDSFSHFDCLKSTTKPIKIVGSCSLETKKKLAEGAPNGNVTY